MHQPYCVFVLRIFDVLQADSPTVPPAVQPIWSVLERQKVVKLEGFATLCMPAILAMHYLDLEVLASKADIETAGDDAGRTRSAEAVSSSAAVPGENHDRRDSHESGTSEAAESDGSGPVTSDDSVSTRSAVGLTSGRMGVCGQMLAALREEFGHDRCFKVARAAAQDALRFGNAVFEVSEGQPQIHQRQVWTEQDVEDYVTLEWCASQVRMRHVSDARSAMPCLASMGSRYRVADSKPGAGTHKRGSRIKGSA